MMTTVVRNPVDTAKEIEALIPTMTDAWVKSKSADLLAFWKRKGWSPAQVGFAEKLIARAKAPAVPATTTIAVATDVSGIVKLFDAGKSRMKNPKVRIAVGNTILLLKIATARSRFPGTINVLDDSGKLNQYGDAEWFGRIHLNGAFEPSRRSDAATTAALVPVLQALAVDPAAACAAYGKLIGHCCFCRLPLGPREGTVPTKESQRSLAVGYGKTCASKWGLPW